MSIFFKKNIEDTGTFYKDAENAAVLLAYYRDRYIYYVSNFISVLFIQKHYYKLFSFIKKNIYITVDEKFHASFFF